MSDEHAIVMMPPPERRLHPLVAAVQAQAALDPATLRDLLAVQREWEAGEARRAFAEAMVALAADLPRIIAHDKTVAFGRTRYSYSTLGQLLDAVTPHLARHGLALTWDASTPEPRVVRVTARLLHAAGHAVESTLAAPPSTKEGMTPAQSIEATITSLRRATLCAVLGVATADQADDASEPAAAPDAAAVDSRRNLEVAAKLRAAGKRVEDAEAEVGRRVAEWTSGDIDRLREWARRES